MKNLANYCTVFLVVKSTNGKIKEFQQLAIKAQAAG